MKSPFLQRVRDSIRAKHYSRRTEETYLYWIKYYIRFHQYQHPESMGENEIRDFLNFLALERQVSASTQKTALNALNYLYRQVLLREPMDFSDFYRARTPKKLPTVLTRAEVSAVLMQLRSPYRLCASLMYGSGLRLMEAVRLRVQDVDLDKLTILVREGKGQKSRITTLASELVTPLKRQIEQVRLYFQEDMMIEGWGGVYLPNALARKYPKAPYELGWQYLFPSDHFSQDPRSSLQRRHHIGEQSLQRAVKKAVRQAEIHKPASCHTLRHSYHPIAIRPCRYPYYRDLYPCSQSWWTCS